MAAVRVCKEGCKQGSEDLDGGGGGGFCGFLRDDNDISLVSYPLLIPPTCSSEARGRTCYERDRMVLDIPVMVADKITIFH